MSNLFVLARRGKNDSMWSRLLLGLHFTLFGIVWQNMAQMSHLLWVYSQVWLEEVKLLIKHFFYFISLIQIKFNSLSYIIKFIFFTCPFVVFCSVVEIEQNVINVGDAVKLRLMRRERGSLIATSVVSEGQKKEIPAPTAFFSVSDNFHCQIYSKLLLANIENVSVCALDKKK